MTGNKNAWRAPLAGLASLAMIATMGVAAGTANAAGVVAGPDKATVTFDKNGYGTDLSNGGKTEVTAADGYKVFSPYTMNAQNGAPAGWVFTGWYTSADLGQGEKVDFTKPFYTDTTVYAHWAKSGDVKTVRFNDPSGVAAFGDSDQDGIANGSGDKSVSLAPGDKLASWEVPVDNKAANNAILEGFEIDRKDAGDLTALVPGAKTTRVTVTASDAQKVTLAGATGVTGYADPAASFDVPFGDPVDLPSAVTGHGNDKKLVDTWNVTAMTLVDANKTATLPADAEFFSGDSIPTDKNGEDVKDVTLTGTSSVDAPKAIMVDYTLNGAENPASVFVSEDESAPTPEVDTQDGLFEFSGWKKDASLQNPYNDEAVKDLTNDGNGHVALHAALTWANTTTDITYTPDYSGSKPIVVKVKPGSVLVWQDAPARDGYVFQGWAGKDNTDLAKNKLYDKNAWNEANKTNSPLKAVTGYNTWTAKWLNNAQDQLNQLLNLPENAYLDNQAKTNYFNKVGEIKSAIGTSDSVAFVDSLSRKSDKTVAAWTKELTELKSKLSVEGQQFSDVFGGEYGAGIATPHADAINFAAVRGLVGGFADGTFHPQSTMKRQDFAAFLYRLAGSPEYTPAASDNIFADVNESTPHYKEILWAAKNGIIKGFADGTFRGMSLVNRQDAAAFFYRLAGEPEFDVAKAGKTFSDVDPASNANHEKEVLWAANTVVSINEDGFTYDGAIAQGYPNGVFAGTNTLLRQDGAAFIARMYAYLNK